jgi:hypothetical protein
MVFWRILKITNSADGLLAASKSSADFANCPPKHVAGDSEENDRKNDGE